MSETIIEINPDYTELEPLVRKVTEKGLPADAEIIYNGRNRIARIKTDGLIVIVKSFRRPMILNALAYTTVRKSKAFRSYANSVRLIEAGFNAPEPIAYSEVRNGFLLRESYYFSTEVKGADLRYWEQREDAEELAEALAEELVRLTRAGVCHLDLSPGNVIFKRDKETGKFVFNYIDLNRMEFDVTDRKQLLRSVFERINELEPVMDLASRFARISGDTSGKTERYARKVRTEFEDWREFKRKVKSIWKRK